MGRVVVETASAALIVIVSAFVAVCAGEPESVAFTVKLAVPAVVGIPLIAPVLAFRASPAGNAPEVMLQVTAPVPPVEASAPLYALFTKPLGKVVVLIASVVGATTIVSSFVDDCAGFPESVTLRVKL